MAISELLRKLTGRPDPVPPGTGQQIQAAAQTEARARLLAQARRRNTAEYRYDRPAR
ncbi:hypothetical protein [Micromonospora sp. NPDC050200]|uniref:hypothetical protein n=1 Tax=Micromonospora sp. NPDC050200 TaxID=3155664 RepID=UPI0033D5E6C6